MKLVGIAVVALALGTGAALSGIGHPAGARSDTGSGARTITVTGSGSVQAVPDRAEFSFGVTTQAATAAQALSANAVLARRVIAALKEAGVAAADLQTENVSLSPRLDDTGDIVGYTASNSVSATLRDLDRAGGIVDDAVGAGANEVSGPSLTRSDQRALYRAALRAAMADATAKAAAIAKASSATLGPVRSVVESSSSIPLPAVRDAAAAVESTPIEAGTQTADATVTVEFALSL